MHQKPRELMRRLIAAVTEPGDLIVDPCAGSFLTLDLALELGRHCYATDIDSSRTETL